MSTLKQLVGAIIIFSLFLFNSVRSETKIDFEDSVLGQLSIITNFYNGVIFNGIANNTSTVGGPYPVSETVPTILGDAVTWSLKSSAQAGGSGANLAVGLVENSPTKAGILMTFTHPISNLTVTGLDYGTFRSEDREEITLTAYDASGNKIGQKHFATQIPGTNAIIGSLTYAAMKYVAFNYTNTRGFFGIDDLSYTGRNPCEQILAEFPARDIIPVKDSVRLAFLQIEGTGLKPVGSAGIRYGDAFRVEARFDAARDESTVTIDLEWDGDAPPRALQLSRKTGSDCIYLSGPLRMVYDGAPRLVEIPEH